MSSARVTPSEVEPVSLLLKALGHETRVRIVALLAHGELCVCHLESALEVSQPEASRQLAVLKNAGVVETRREGSWVHYRLATPEDPLCRAQLEALAGGFRARKGLARELQRLTRLQGPDACK